MVKKDRRTSLHLDTLLDTLLGRSFVSTETQRRSRTKPEREGLFYRGLDEETTGVEVWTYESEKNTVKEVVGGVAL